MSLPVLLIPGLNCSARLYAGQIPALWSRGSVMVADHKRGETIAEIAGHILDAAPRSFALVGFSLGGYLALEIMRRAADRVERLALVDTSARPDTPEQAEMRRKRMKMALNGRFAETVAQQFPLSTHPSRHCDDKLRGEFLAMAQDCGPDAFVRQLQAAMSRPDSRADLARIRCPTFVVVGDSDAITTPTLAKEIVDGIPGSRLRTISDAGHLTPLERPETVAQTLLEFLDAK